MAYIVAHGTVNGYRKITQNLQAGSEQKVLTDIRDEFNSTQTMLQNPIGYILQMAPNGVWISIVRLLFDGERSGNGAGFFAFSAFVPNNILIPGEIIKTTLDELMNTYRGIIGGDFTKNIGVDWSFVEQASQRLNAQCKQRRKAAVTNYVPSDKFAYVEISSPAAIPLYLEKPFQPEYGAYKAVFLGTTLQNPNRISTHSKLDIDFENEQYEIVWKGDKHLYHDIPNFVREKEIQTAFHTFTKPYYKDTTVYFRNGKIDEANCVIEMEIPRLQAQEYKIQILYSSNDGAGENVVTSLVVKSINSSPVISLPQEQKNYIVFRGEEVRNIWSVSAKTIGGYAASEVSIAPEKQSVVSITLHKVKTIAVQIRKDGILDTNKWRNKIQFENRKTHTIELTGAFYSKEKDCILFTIRENEDFLTLYDIRCDTGYKQQIEPIHGLVNAYVIDLKKIEYTTLNDQYRNQFGFTPKLQKNIKISVPKQFYDSGRPFNIFLSNNNTISFKEINSDSDPCELEIENSENKRGEDFTIQSKGKTLKNIKYSSDGKIIYILPPQSVADVVLGWFRDSYKVLLTAVAGALILAAMVIATLHGFGVVNVMDWFSKDKGGVVDNSQGFNQSMDDTKSAEDGNSGVEYEMESAYDELEQALLEQGEMWNDKTACEMVVKYAGEDGEKTADLRENNPEAYKLMKQLSWLYRTRQFVNKREWAKLKSFLLKPDGKEYADAEKLNFLNELISPSNKNACDLFEAEIIRDINFPKKDYSQVKTLWEKCKEEASEAGASISAGAGSRGESDPYRHTPRGRDGSALDD